MADAPKVRRGLPRVNDGRAEAAPASPGTPARRGLPRSATAAPLEAPADAAPEVAAAASGSTLGRRKRVIGAAAAIVGAAIVVVLVARWFVDLGFMREFLSDYPGEYQLPQGAPVGLPVWLNWTHFFSAFLMILIVRTGLQLRRETRPPAFWTPRSNSERKISLTVWLHQALDLLWIANGAIFLILLFATGQWMRIVPTSWEVLPNAASAALQYVSLQWPTENGWANYNSLQQLAYFTTVFGAAPLAILTGVRLSGLWPKGASTLSRIYPTQMARAIHFRVMQYFVAFIVVHVTFVFATGPLRNLNHMFAARGSVDPAKYVWNWTGLCFFLAAVLVTGLGLLATTKPRLIAPAASLFGKVSGR